MTIVDGLENRQPTNFDGQSETVLSETPVSFNPEISKVNVPVPNAISIGLINICFLVELNDLQFTLLDSHYFYDNHVTVGTSAAQYRQNG